jgi:Ni/Co efflux regulator RcnB
MNKKYLLTALLSACLAASGAAMAQEHHDDNHGHEQADHHDDHHDERGAGPRHDMHKGDHLAPEYRGNKYVVSDWRGHHLSAPPRGYHWVNAGGDYVLVAVASGVIADLLLSH